MKKGDTLYSIALEYGFDYRELAQWNKLEDPNRILVDQVLRLTQPEGESGVVVTPLASSETTAKPAEPAAKAVAPLALKDGPKLIKQSYSDKALAAVEQLAIESAKVKAPPVAVLAKAAAKPTDKTDVKATGDARVAGAKAGAAPADKGEQKPDAKADAKQDSTKAAAGVESNDDVDSWQWPVVGKLIGGFAASGKGIDIGGKRGQPVLAAAAGKVVYSGTGLRGYGRLLIVKHNKTYLTAYAHNQQLLVKEGEVVNKGDKIAEMGDSDTDQVKLHFEIRRFGKPVDPLKYLPAEKS
ncbi:peptidoglycan DD-metalloendopeptidase family protein [Chitinivorax sp. PXF-14]|uniref:peptidoglycan DD-metalloendopeptidase family protein n=1 Tax=Chitinivorax sp. PXF-14 TaxID=3230488 RepID=UPI0034654315